MTLSCNISRDKHARKNQISASAEVNLGTRKLKLQEKCNSKDVEKHIHENHISGEKKS